MDLSCSKGLGGREEINMLKQYTLENIFIIVVISTVIQFILVKDTFTKKQKKMIAFL